MSEANTIFDRDGHIVATAKHGVAWCRASGARLGEYDDGEAGAIYDSHTHVAGRFYGGEVLGPDGVSVGRCVTAEVPGTGLVAKRLYLGDREVGHCIGSVAAASAVLLLLFAARARGVTSADA